MPHQPETTLIELIRYNNWANARLLDALQALTSEQLNTGGPGAYGSIIETLGHIIWAEADYVNRMTGAGPQPPARAEGQPALAWIAAYAARVAPALLDAAQRIPPEQIVHEAEDGNTMDYQARLLFLQAIDHGIEHRTNITTILSALGLPAPEIDGWGYLFAHPGEFALQETSAQPPEGGN